MDVVAPLVAHRQSPVAVQPRDRTFNYPAIPPEPLATLDSLPRYPHLDAVLTEGLAALTSVVGFVSVDLLRLLTRPASALPLDQLYGIYYFFEHHGIVDVCPRLYGN